VLLATRLGDGRRFHGYDVFGQIPPPGENDPPEVHERYAVITAGKSTGIGGDVYYGYRADLLEHVSATFERYGLAVGERIQLHKGLFEDTLHPEDAIALAHIDSDWYDPVKLCLERIHPKLSPGGLIVLDDYFDWGGCRRATDEFLASRPDMDIVAAPDNVVLAKRR
jgi:asparagine synthase (glutamine-hydrolysing)